MERGGKRKGRERDRRIRREGRRQTGKEAEPAGGEREKTIRLTLLSKVEYSWRA